MSMEIKRLHLARLRGPDGLEWPVHGFVVTYPGGAALVDTGVGGPDELLNDWRVVNRSVADALGVFRVALEFGREHPLLEHGSHADQDDDEGAGEKAPP